MMTMVMVMILATASGAYNWGTTTGGQQARVGAGEIGRGRCCGGGCGGCQLLIIIDYRLVATHYAETVVVVVVV